MKPTLFVFDSKQIYLFILAVSLIFSYIPGQDKIAALVYYGSCFFIVSCFITNKSYLRPGYVFLLLLNPYVATGTLGLWIDIKEVFPFFPSFGGDEFLGVFRVGLVALLGVALPLAWDRTPNRPCGKETASRCKLEYGFVLLLLIMTAIAFDFAYAYSRKEAFIEGYIFTVEGVHDQVVVMPLVGLNLLILGLTVIYLAYEPKWYRSGFFWSTVGLFLWFCFMTGNRTALVMHFLVIFWRYYSQHGLKLIEKFLVKLVGIAAAIVILGAISLYRQGGVDFMNALMEGYTLIIYEFSGALISGLYSVQHVQSGDGPPLLLGLLDPVWGTIPSFLIPLKRELLTFHTWLEGTGGGYYRLSPVGGFYTAGNLYLITGSLLGVFVYFSLFSSLLVWGYRNLFQAQPIALTRALLSVSLVLWLGLRYEYWIIGKMIILWVWLFPLLAFYILRIFITPVTRLNKV